jgi:hypothetical protein
MLIAHCVSEGEDGEVCAKFLKLKLKSAQRKVNESEVGVEVKETQTPPILKSKPFKTLLLTRSPTTPPLQDQKSSNRVSDPNVSGSEAAAKLRIRDPTTEATLPMIARSVHMHLSLSKFTRRCGPRGAATRMSRSIWDLT